ncbi:MAG: hypothetical protein II642_01245 [Firmicutes bacterium]|nr:hypothetical protein [Bacillota bacterium]
MKKIIILMMAAMLILTACSKTNDGNASDTTDESSNTTSSEQNSEETAETSEESTESAAPQLALEDVLGVYGAGRPTLRIDQGEGANQVLISIFWSSSAFEHVEWHMTGSFDPATATITYQDCVKSIIVYEADGSVKSQKDEYENGTGCFIVNEDGTISWKDGIDQMGDGLVFTNEAPEEGSGDPNFYQTVTSIEKSEVEAFAMIARDAYLAEDWETLADMIYYPIIMYPEEIELADKEEFLDYMSDKTVDESDREAMEREDCVDMFIHREQIGLGEGEIWITDYSELSGEEPKLEIITINGLVTK